MNSIHKLVALVGLGAFATGANAQYTSQVFVTPAGFSKATVNGISGGGPAGYVGELSANPHAAIWDPGSGTATDLNPVGYTGSVITGTFGSYQFGYTRGPGGDKGAIWQSTAASHVQLTTSQFPPDFDNTEVQGFNGTTAVGNGRNGMSGGLLGKAILWQNYLSGAITNLHPAGFDLSSALAVEGGDQVGYAGDTLNLNAILWHGSATGYVNLNPGGFASSAALDMQGGLQGGWGTGTSTGGEQHALLWSGTAASYQDLNPAGMVSSTILDLGDGIQVGYARPVSIRATGPTFAYLWNGSAGTALNLNDFLPTGYSQSYATAVDENGIIVGDALNAVGERVAVRWTPVPEPSSIGALALGAWSLRRRLHAKSSKS